MDTIEFKGKTYPAFQTNGNAARFCMPFALEICKGVGYDIGCNREEWAFPGSIMIDRAFDDGKDAHKLPWDLVDYVFSSHCLEHVYDWIDALEVWTDRIKSGGHLFLYLPDYSQEYWRPWNNRKHVNIFTPEIIRDYLEHTGLYKNIFVSGVDAYNSFMAFAQKI
jgi:SAM-dependent methyltransferase